MIGLIFGETAFPKYVLKKVKECAKDLCQIWHEINKILLDVWFECYLFLFVIVLETVLKCSSLIICGLSNEGARLYKNSGIN